jgi:dGTPase
MPMTLAPYACLPQESRGRLHPEESCFMRDPLQRDRDRIIHSTAFRRLKHKAQVFIANEGEYYRTRLTHSMEVAQIARGISRKFSLNEDLSEAISLAHDFGHPPFGHAGEDALMDAMKDAGGFNHNDQTFRILTQLEKKYPLFSGLNLSWETLEGIVKHNGPILGGFENNPALRAIFDFNASFDLTLQTYPSAEAQVAAIADDIAYNSHDIDDGFKAGLFGLTDLNQVPVIAEILASIERTYPGLSDDNRVQETIRRLINHLVSDLTDETKKRLEDCNPQSAQDIRELTLPIVSLSEKGARDIASIRAFLSDHMYFHPMVLEMKAIGRAVVRDLYTTKLHQSFSPENPKPYIEIADSIAQLTDLEALHAHEKLTGRRYISPVQSLLKRSAS